MYQSYLTKWGAIWESNPFMLGSQPSVFTVSPMAPQREYIRRIGRDWQGNFISWRHILPW